MTVITSEMVETQVFMAIDNDHYLPIDQKVSLEYLAEEYDGCFPNRQSWCAFCRGNFERDHAGYFYYEDELKQTTVKRWTRALEEYKNKFVAMVGKDRYTSVNADDLEFEFTYELNFKHGEKYPVSVEFYVKATIA